MHVPKEKTTKFYIDVAIILFLMFGFGYLPPFGPITEYGMHVLGIFLGLIYSWLLGQYIWASLTGLVALGLCGSNTVTAMLTSAYGNATLLLVLWAIIFCYVLQRSGLLDVVAAAVLTNKLAGKGPWAFAAIVWTAAALASLVATNCTAVIIMIWSILYGIFDKLNIPKFDKYSQLLMIGVAVFGYLGMTVLPVNSSTQFILGLMRAVNPETTINWLAYSAFTFAITVITIPLMVLFFKYIVRVKAPFSNFDTNIINVEKKSMNTTQKLVIFYLLVLCAGIILPAFLPKDFILTTLLNRIGTNGMFVVVNIAMVLTVIQGESIQDITEALKNIVPWDIYYMLATALVISSAVIDASTGIPAVISAALGTLLAGKGAFVFMALMIIIGTIMTNVCNNAVTMAILVPISYSFMSVTGGNFTGLCVIFCIVLLQGVIFPSGSFAGALMHGNSEWLKPTDIYKFATLQMVVLIAVVIFFGIPLANFLF